MAKTVYCPMVADYLHPGHLNIIKVAAELGEVIIGLYSDKATASYKRVPFMTFEQRKQLLENIKGVSKVVKQDEKDYENNLRKYKPDYMVHGKDWQVGTLSKSREKAIAILAEWGGQIVEPDYTIGISSTDMHKHTKTSGGILPNFRLSYLRRLINVKPLVRVMEAHSGLSAMVVENAEYKNEQETRSFDAIWLSSLTDSTVKGKPDIEFVDLTSRIQTVNDILECTTKPIIYDGDTGSYPEHFALTVKRLERLGVSAVIIEDKTGAKRNSLLDPNSAVHIQDTIENVSEKIMAGKKAQLTDDFMIFARIESLIVESGMADALARSKAFINAGADGIMIHSRKSDGAEILEFCKHYNEFENRKPLVVVPTNYSSVTESILKDAGVNIVIYANQLLRSAYSAMQKTASGILKHSRSFEADENYISALELINLIEGNC